MARKGLIVIATGMDGICVYTKMYTKILFIFLSPILNDRNLHYRPGWGGGGGRVQNKLFPRTHSLLMLKLFEH